MATSMSSNDERADTQLTERICLVRFAYHLWRVDTAARAFVGLDRATVDIELMKKRWEIGLVLELVSRHLCFASAQPFRII